jgi:VWFA-related protein
MIKLLTRLSFIFSILLCSLSLLAGQFVKIERIDASSIAYPKVQVFLRIDGIHESDITAPDEKILTFYEDGSRVDDSITVTKQIDTEQYLYLVFSIDSSKSISKKFLSQIKSSARDIVRSIGPQDKIAVYRFNDHVSLLNTFTQNTDQIIKNINSVKRHGKKTLLYSAIYDSIELLDKVKQINKKIIVFTDGKDEGSNVSEEDVIQKARNSGIPIYFISFKNSNEIRIMANISKLTGGKLIYSTSHDDVAGMYRTILSCMNNRYSAAYQTHLKKDGMNHTIEVRLNNGDIRDQDSKLIRLDTDFISRDLLSLNGYICLVIIFFLIIVLFIVIIYFLNREKRYFQEQYEIEKRLLLDKTLVPGELKGDRTDTEQQAISFEDEECHYANAWLYQKDGPEMGKKYLIQSQETTIGCGNENSIVINDELISVHHAKIKNINGIYHMFDLISDHGTYLNGKKLLRPKALHDWDEIKIGQIILIFRGTTHPR